MTATDSVQEPRARISGAPAIIGVIGFLTLVDLFAAQAILPSLAKRFAASPSEIGIAVNAGTIGMAIAGVGVVFWGRRVDRRVGVVASLAALSIPTLLLAAASDLATFAALRIIQGLFMVTAFSLTMSYLSERCSAAQSATALAAYVTGVVASNLIGRLISGSLADSFGVPANFIFFAALNLSGAVVAALALKRAEPMASGFESARSPIAIISDHLGNACLRTSFAIGFLILFAFIGVFTYVNFVLAAPPLALTPMSLSLVYFVFLPSMFTTPAAGRIAARRGARASFFGSLALALCGLPMLLSFSLPVVLMGLAIVGVGTFFAQATATGFVGRAAKHDRAAASGLYLSFYYLGGLAGAAFLGWVFDRFGWPATVCVIAVALALAGGLAATLRTSTAEPARA
ncbi:MAG: MFS transporter [Alphaproteobacteria bacterium RIFCSPHIGHO2_12_FULL_63_12]|nr:MAG: MFS transporter [Alphaproteobacteria bacterium RIFCSPHIGHO2_12_FULL_63_12]